MLNREEYDKQNANLSPIATNQTLDGVVGKTGKDEKPNLHIHRYYTYILSIHSPQKLVLL